jgi:hypothetical protein
MKHLAALLVVVAATAGPALAHPRGSHRVVLGGSLSYTAQGQADAAMIGFGVSLFAQAVSAIAYDGCRRASA